MSRAGKHLRLPTLQLNANVLAISLMLFLALQAIVVLYIPTFKPVKTFITYYGCKIIEISAMVNTNCDTLPTITIQPPRRKNALMIGADDPLELRLFFQTSSVPEHIYAHRTNSAERARLYRRYYRAYEFDAIWDSEKQQVDIYHWPEHQSIEFYLPELLQIMPPDRRYWMDLKNLTSNNAQSFASYMENIFERHSNLKKESIIIESQNPEAVALLTGKGFITSYYLPAITTGKTCRSLEQTETILGNISQHDSSYISFPYSQQPFVDECILPITGPLKQLSWGGLPYAIPEGAIQRYRAYIVDHSNSLNGRID